MKLLWQIISIVAVAHMIVLIGFIAWLGATDRLSRDRMEAMKYLFTPTLAQAAEMETQAQEQAKQAEKEADRMARAAGMGPPTTIEALESGQTDDDQMLSRLERTKRAIEDLQRNLTLTRQRLEAQREQFMQARQQAEQRLDEIEQRMNESGFQRNVTLFEHLPPEQVKNLFKELMKQGRTEQIVMYLQAMEPRKAAAVLGEFTEPQEVAQVAELTERLRERGSDLIQQAENTG